MKYFFLILDNLYESTNAHKENHSVIFDKKGGIKY